LLDDDPGAAASFMADRLYRSRAQRRVLTIGHRIVDTRRASTLQPRRGWPAILQSPMAAFGL